MAPSPLAGALAPVSKWLSVLVEQLPAGLVVFDDGGRLLMHNPTLVNIVGEVPANGQSLRFFASDGGELSGPASPVARALAGETVSGEELLLSTAKGPLPIKVTAVPLDGGGPAPGIALLLCDSGRESLQRETLGVIGHDLRNPLAAIRITAQLLARTDDIPPERRLSLANRVLSSSKRMESIVRTLLDYARAGGGELLHLELEPLDLGEVAHRVIAEQGAAHTSRPLRVEAQGDLTGHWDASRLEQLLGHLVSNAFRYGIGEIAVTLDGSAPSHVAVTVANEGKPIPAAVLSHLFEPFKSAERAPGGRRRSVGLGLFMVKRLAEAHGGGVEVISDASRTEFRVTLPRGEAVPVTDR